MNDGQLVLEWWWSLLLLPLPLLFRRLLKPLSEDSAAIRVPFYDEITTLSQAPLAFGQKRGIARYVLAAVWILLVLALSRPTLVGDAVAVKSEARDLFLAVDISGSMEERDMSINNQLVQRIDMIKYVLSDFIARRQGDRLGLILFADNAYIQAPLTYDTDTVNLLLEQAQLGFAGQKTAIGDAIGLAVKQLTERPGDSRTLVLLTDGASNAGNVKPLDAAAVAAENAIRIYTVGIGGEQQAFSSLFGSSIIPPRARNIDENTLKQIAQLTGGRFFRADNSQQLEQIYRVLDELEPVEQEEQLFRPRKQLFYWPLGMALALTMLWSTLRYASDLFTARDTG